MFHLVLQFAASKATGFVKQIRLRYISVFSLGTARENESGTR